MISGLPQRIERRISAALRWQKAQRLRTLDARTRELGIDDSDGISLEDLVRLHDVVAVRHQGPTRTRLITAGEWGGGKTKWRPRQ